MLDVVIVPRHPLVQNNDAGGALSTFSVKSREPDRTAAVGYSKDSTDTFSISQGQGTVAVLEDHVVALFTRDCDQVCRDEGCQNENHLAFNYNTASGACFMCLRQDRHTADGIFEMHRSQEFWYDLKRSTAYKKYRKRQSEVDDSEPFKLHVTMPLAPDHSLIDRSAPAPVAVDRTHGSQRVRADLSQNRPPSIATAASRKKMEAARQRLSGEKALMRTIIETMVREPGCPTKWTKEHIEAVLSVIYSQDEQVSTVTSQISI